MYSPVDEEHLGVVPDSIEPAVVVVTQHTQEEEQAKTYRPHTHQATLNHLRIDRQKNEKRERGEGEWGERERERKRREREREREREMVVVGGGGGGGTMNNDDPNQMMMTGQESESP